MCKHYFSLIHFCITNNEKYKMRILTGLAAAGVGEIASRFAKLSFSILVPGTNDSAVALARAGAITIEAKKTHPSYSSKKIMEVGALLNRGEIDAFLLSQIEVHIQGADSVVEFDLLIVYPSKMVNGVSQFGGNIEPLENEKYVFTFGGFANGVTVTLDALELAGGKATRMVDYKSTYCNPNVVTPVNTRSAELLAIPRANLISIDLKYGASAPGGARSITKTPSEIKSEMNDFKQAVYNKNGLVSQPELYFILDVTNVDTANVLLNAGANVELLIPVYA